MECPWCHTRSAEHRFGKGVQNSVQQSAKSTRRVPYSATKDDGVSEGVAPTDATVRGALAEHCASLVMQLLFAARVGRFDLLRIVGLLASRVTKWTKACDK